MPVALLVWLVRNADFAPRCARRLAATLLLAAAALAPRAAAHTPHDVIEAWAMSPAFPADHTLFVAMPRFNLLLRSTDAGETWTSCVKGLESAYVFAMAISPDFAKDRTLWCVEVAGLFVSRDAGESWQKLELPEGMQDAVAVAATSSPESGTLLAITTRKKGALALSFDGGKTFTAQTGLRDMSQLPCDPVLSAAGGALSIVCGGEVVITRSVAVPSCTVSWRQDLPADMQAPEPGPLHGLRVVALDPLDSERLWVVGKPPGVWRRQAIPYRGGSHQEDEEWIREGDLPEGAKVLHLSVARETDVTIVLFAATADHGIQIKRGDGPWTASLDGFREPTHQTKQHWVGTMVSPGWATDHTVYACCYEGLYVSTDGGGHWRWLNTLHPQLVRNVALSPRFADDGALWLSTYGLGLQHSEDRGKTFSKVDTASWEFPDGIAVSRDWQPAGADAPATGALLIGTPNNLLLSRDGGATVASCLPRTKGFPRVLAFAPDWASSGIAFAHLSTDTGLKTNRFMRTADHGATWTDTNIRTAYDFACAPDWDTTGACWAACPDGLFRSDDRGVTFAKVEGLSATGLNSVAVAPGAPAEGGGVGPPCVAVASTGQGLFLSRDGGASWSAPGNPPARTSFVRFSPDFARDGLLFAGTHTDGLWFSHDGGAHWDRGKGGPRMTLCLELSPTFAQDHTLVVGAYEQPWISSDAGATWRALELPIPAGYVPDASREGDVDAALPPAPHKSGG